MEEAIDCLIKSRVPRDLPKLRSVRFKENILLLILTKQILFLQDDLPPTVPVAPVAPVVGGRAKLFHYLRDLEISRPTAIREENEAQASGVKVVRPVVADVVPPEQVEEEEPEIVVKRGKAGKILVLFY